MVSPAETYIEISNKSYDIIQFYTTKITEIMNTIATYGDSDKNKMLSKSQQG